MKAFAKRPFVRQAFGIYVLQAVGMAAALVTSIVFARSLGAAGKGATDLFVVLTTLVAEFGLLGIAYGFTYVLANRGWPLAQAHGNALVAALIPGAIGVGLALLVLGTAGVLRGAVDVPLVVLLLIIVGFLAYSAGWSGLMYGVNEAQLIFRVQAIASIATTIVTGLLVLLGWLTVETALAVIAIVAIATAGVRFRLARRMHGSEPLAPSLDSFLESLRYGLKLFPGRIANWLHFRVDLLIVNYVVGLSGVGIYAVSVRWAEVLWLVGFGVQSAAVHRIASGTKEAGYDFTVRVFWIVLVMTGGAGLALALVAGPLIRALYGPEFDASVVPLLLLIPGVVAWDSARALSNFIAYNRGYPQIPAAIGVAGAVCNLAANLYAVPTWGINGAAVTTSITYSLVLLATLLAFRRVGAEVAPGLGQEQPSAGLPK